MNRKPLLFILATLALFVIVVPAHAQSASAVFAGPQNMDAGLKNGLNNLTGYVHFLSFGPNSLEAKAIPIIQGEEVDRADGRLLASLKMADSEACR